MSSRIRLLIVDDEQRFLDTLSARLALRDFDVSKASNGEQALTLAREKSFDLALVDLKMPGLSGEEVLLALKREHPLLEVVILTGHGSIDSAVQCTEAGSYKYLSKPCETEELLTVLKDAYQLRLRRKLQVDQERLEQLMDVAQGESPLGILRRLKKLDREPDRG